LHADGTDVRTLPQIVGHTGDRSRPYLCVRVEEEHRTAGIEV